MIHAETLVLCRTETQPQLSTDQCVAAGQANLHASVSKSVKVRLQTFPLFQMGLLRLGGLWCKIKGSE